MREDIINIIYRYSTDEISTVDCWNLLEPIRKDKLYLEFFSILELEKLEGWFLRLDMTSEQRRKPVNILGTILYKLHNWFGDYAISAEVTREQAVTLIKYLEPIK